MVLVRRTFFLLIFFPLFFNIWQSQYLPQKVHHQLSSLLGSKSLLQRFKSAFTSLSLLGQIKLGLPYTTTISVWYLTQKPSRTSTIGHMLSNLKGLGLRPTSTVTAVEQKRNMFGQRSGKRNSHHRRKAIFSTKKTKTGQYGT